MNDPGGHRGTRRWIAPMLVLVALVATFLTIGQVVDPVPAFIGAIVALLALGLVAAALGGVTRLEASPPRLRWIVGVLLWLVAVGTVFYLAAIWSDFGTP